MTADNPLFSAIYLFCVIPCISELVYSRHCHGSICGIAVNGGGLFGIPRSHSRPAQAELISLTLRACGCNDSIDADEVLDSVTAICHFMEATRLSNTNSTKILELEDELSSMSSLGKTRLRLHRSPKMRCCLLAIDNTHIVGCMYAINFNIYINPESGYMALVMNCSC
jgi:hypothetical protein